MVRRDYPCSMVVDEAEVAATIIAFQRPLEADMASAIDGVWRADMTGRPVPGDPPGVVQFRIIAALSSADSNGFMAPNLAPN